MDTCGIKRDSSVRDWVYSMDLRTPVRTDSWVSDEEWDSGESEEYLGCDYTDRLRFRTDPAALDREVSRCR